MVKLDYRFVDFAAGVGFPSVFVLVLGRALLVAHYESLELCVGVVKLRQPNSSLVCPSIVGKSSSSNIGEQRSWKEEDERK